MKVVPLQQLELLLDMAQKCRLPLVLQLQPEKSDTYLVVAKINHKCIIDVNKKIIINLLGILKK